MTANGARRAPARPQITLTRAQARRIALAAQGFADPPPRGRVDVRALRRVLGRVGVLQIDSVNVLARAHYLPVFARLGAYPMAALDKTANAAPREMFEYWAHVASYVPVATQPLLRWRMAEAHHVWRHPRAIWRREPALVERVREAVGELGPITATDLEVALEHDVRQVTGGWGWNWSDVKEALEFLFYAGGVTSAGRTAFRRLYDIPERVLPADVLATPTPAPADAHRELIRIAARSHGVGTTQCLRDYFRLSVRTAQAAIDELVEDGELLPAQIEGWQRPAYLHADAARPRRLRARALLSPFDSVVFERERTEQLYGMRYRIEIYTREPDRVYGYYVLPFLLGDTLVGRVDLKADRQAGVLRVQAVHSEPDAPGDTATELAAELALMAEWMGLDAIAVEGRGDLAPALAAAVARLDGGGLAGRAV